MSYDAVILDRDGVILKFEDYSWINRQKVEKASDLGIRLSEEEAKEKILSDSVLEMEEFMEVKGMTWSDLRKILEHVSEIQKKYMAERRLELFPSAKESIESLDKSLGLVTNASKDSTDFFLEEFGLEETFDCIVAPPRKVRERVEKRKPHPHMLNKAVECLGSDNPVFLGDSRKDRLAAENARVEFVKVDGNIASLLKKFN